VEGRDVEVRPATCVDDAAQPRATRSGVVDASAFYHLNRRIGALHGGESRLEDAADVLGWIVGDKRLTAIRLIPHLDRGDPAAVTTHEGGDECLEICGGRECGVAAVPCRRVNQDRIDQDPV